MVTAASDSFRHAEQTGDSTEGSVDADGLSTRGARRVPSGRAISHCGGDPLRRVGDGFVLPDPDHFPPGLHEKSIGLLVPASISSDLVRPELRVCDRHGVVLRASVPEAAIDEDSHLRPGEDQVGGSANPGKWAAIHSVSQAHRVYRSTDGEFRFRVPRRVRPHARTDAGRRCPRLAGSARDRRARRFGGTRLSHRDKCVSELLILNDDDDRRVDPASDRACCLSRAAI